MHMRLKIHRSDDAVNPPPLAVLGLVLNPDLAKRSMDGVVGWESTFDEEQRVRIERIRREIDA